VALERVHIVGNLFGTLVAQCFAMYHSERIIKTVLTGTVVGWTDMSEVQKARAIADREAQVRSRRLQLWCASGRAGRPGDIIEAARTRAHLHVSKFFRASATCRRSKRPCK
jgi:pimeloyl-ACP methyl ester carboxylesterase